MASLASVSAAAFPEQSVSVNYTRPAQSAPLGSTFVDWDSLKAQPTPLGHYRSVFDARTATLEKIEVHVTTLNPGMESHKPHHHPWEEILLVKDGNMQVSINGEKSRAGPGAMIFIASHDVHNIANVGDKPATYYVINFCTGAMRRVRRQPAAEWAPPGTLRSCVIDCESLPATPTGTGLLRSVVDSPTLTFARLESHISTLNPGAEGAPARRVPGDEIVVVKSGAIEATVNGITCRAGAGSFFFFASNDERSIKNPGPAPASYQVINVVSDKAQRRPGA